METDGFFSEEVNTFKINDQDSNTADLNDSSTMNVQMKGSFETSISTKRPERRDILLAA